MSDTASDASDNETGDTPPASPPRPTRPAPRRTQRDILERAYDGITAITDLDEEQTRFIKAVSGYPSGELLKLVYPDGDVWWLTAVRGDER